MEHSKCPRLRGRVPHVYEYPELDTKPVLSSWLQPRAPGLLLCQRILPMAALLAQTEATVTFVQVYLKHLMGLAWFQGSYARLPQFVCAMVQSKPINTSKKRPTPKQFLTLMLKPLPYKKKKKKTTLIILALPLLLT